MPKITEGKTNQKAITKITKVTKITNKKNHKIITKSKITKITEEVGTTMSLEKQKKLFVEAINRPNFLVLKKAGIRSERFSKKLLWKIFNIYMVVICHNRFFQKRVTKKKFFFRDPFFTYKKGVSEIDD